ncbi:MAG: porphobilinogen synthase [Lentisphaerae bacterium]|jgi:porphobilinogen synthase|nr:porphobilinogen synthase [Lentisphaerota bacterium]MBT4820177.1 porphobilinogen synthase [Lentisphaerota bacterium]MBT5610958.1 porphobilinogen synthase [Lentisphaerota bacterium]MBT7062214.1 porphobilinogen synthase [Lentisphaerota bacterium]MBT7848054.1 porphobilinogen synthase [Lentisphaerota bacterium]
MSFPVTRMRRLRQSSALREMLAETALSANDFIMPLFVRPGKGVRNPISSMPGNYQMSIDVLVEACEELLAAGVRMVILFGIPEHKDAVGSEGYADDGIIQCAVRALRENVPEMLVCTDVCLCEYTDHGHCGVIRDGRVDNDPTLDLLTEMSLSHARAGAHVVAPSDMMDGRIGAVRNALDADGFDQTVIMAYSAKYASSFYGPFRDAAESPPQFGDRRAYQMDFRNAREAGREIALDIAEGADIVMVKPALPYLDIIRTVRDSVSLPVAAYSVSGEFAMVKAAAANGWLDERRVALEMLYSIKRAGADLILTYWACDAARWLKEDGACL